VATLLGEFDELVALFGGQDLVELLHGVGHELEACLAPLGAARVLHLPAFLNGRHEGRLVEVLGVHERRGGHPFPLAHAFAGFAHLLLFRPKGLAILRHDGLDLLFLLGTEIELPVHRFEHPLQMAGVVPLLRPLMAPVLAVGHPRRGLEGRSRRTRGSLRGVERSRQPQSQRACDQSFRHFHGRSFLVAVRD